MQGVSVGMCKNHYRTATKARRIKQTEMRQFIDKNDVKIRTQTRYSGESAEVT